MGFFTAITTAIGVGLGCGACCSPFISIFLSTYVVSHTNGVRGGLKSFFSFFLGKVLSITILCTLAAILGNQLLNENGYIGSINLRLATQVVMSGLGLFLVIKWFVELIRNKEPCQSCKSCKPSIHNAKTTPLFIAGLVYGATPCAPLLLMLGYAFSLPVYTASTTGIAFGLASIASPILLLSVVTGALSKHMSNELPTYIRYFRLAAYVLLMVMPFSVGVV